jgi:hypothetical protein
MKLTRRQLAAVVSVFPAVGGFAAGIARAQTEQPAAAPADELQSARQRLKANSDLLAQQQVPMSTEPAFRFKV